MARGCRRLLAPALARRSRLLALAFIGAVGALTLSAELNEASGGGLGPSRRGCWVMTWGASPQPAVPGSATAAVGDATVRDLLTSTIGGPAVRVLLTNSFGANPLVIADATIGLAGSGAAVSSERWLTFDGRRSTILRPGAQVLSGPIGLPVAALQRLAVSLYTPTWTTRVTEHRDANQVSYIAAGDHAGDPGAAAFRRRILSWLFVDGLEVRSPGCRARAVVALGDSLTDGYGSGVNADARWTDDLARRLAATPGADLAVINEGIAGNRLLHSSQCCGVAALARLDRDVLAQPGATDLILLEGINDIGFSELKGRRLNAPHTEVTGAQIIAADEQIVGRAHAAGLRVFAGTLLPFRGAVYWTPRGERVREQVNNWIRTSHVFDGVIDFAAAVADPHDPERLNPAYDVGDHLHLNNAGYRAMAAAINAQTLRAPTPDRERG